MVSRKSGGETEFRNLYRFDIAAQKEYFTKKPYIELYNGIVVGAHIATYFSKLVRELTRTKSFVIDPMTYIFARERDKMEKPKIQESGAVIKNLKKSYEKLAEIYGSEFYKIINTEQRKLEIDDFKKNGSWNEEFIDEFTKHVIDFQKTFKTQAYSLLPLDILELMEPNEKPIEKKPNLFAVIPPYFYSSNITDEWYDLSRKLAEKTKNLTQKDKICPVICVSKEFLSNGKWQSKIIEHYRKFKRIVLWISGFNEFREDEDSLTSIAQFISVMSKDIKIYSAYGGFFFVILSKLGLHGYSQGMCYGEFKPVDKEPATFPPPARYYIPVLHKKVSVDNARAYYVQFPDELCDCEVCIDLKNDITEKEGIKIGKKPTEFVDKFFNRIKDDNSRSIHHFLACRKEEIDYVEKNDLKTIISKLNSDLDKSTELKMPQFSGFENSHLENWIFALSKFVQ